MVLPPPRRFLAVDQDVFKKEKEKNKSYQTAKGALLFDLKLQDEKMVNLLITIVSPFCFVFPGSKKRRPDGTRDMSDEEKAPVAHVVYSTPTSCSSEKMYLHSAELNVVAVTENVNTFLLV